MAKIYKGQISFMHRQGNLRANVYDKLFKPNFQKVLENYSTGISMRGVNAAQAKADEVKNIAARSVEKMNQNAAVTEALLADSQQINLLAQDFQKNAHELEVVVQKQSWWMCSKQCLMVFGGLFVFIVLLWLLLKIF